MAIVAAAMVIASLGPAGARPSGELVAITRCDARQINGYYDQVHNWEGRPPRAGDDQLKRLADLQDVINGLAQERNILDAVCPSNMPRAPYFSQIAATQGYAYEVEAQLMLAIGPPCASAGNAIPTQLAASAWYALANDIVANNATNPPVAQIIPKVEALAAQIKLTLPAPADTSAYWVQQIQATTKTAIEACHLAPPSPTPVPTPVETPGD